MAERMTTSNESRSAIRQFQAELVTKEDGRYLIYYSWPDEESRDYGGDGEAVGQEVPQQALWSPEAGPTDV